MTHKSVKGWLWEQVISFPLKPLDGLEGVGKVIAHKANLQLQVWQHVVGKGRGWRKVTVVLPPAFSFRRRQTGKETCWLLLDYFFHPVVFASESWWTSVPWLSTRRSTFVVLLTYSGGFPGIAADKDSKEKPITQAGLGGLRMGVLACHLDCQKTISKILNNRGCVYEPIFQLVTLAMKPDFQLLDVRIKEPVWSRCRVRCALFPRDWVLSTHWWQQPWKETFPEQTCVSKSPSIWRGRHIGWDHTSPSKDRDWSWICHAGRANGSLTSTTPVSGFLRR